MHRNVIVAQIPPATCTTFSHFTFRGSSESFPFALHDPISIAGGDESAMNPREINENCGLIRREAADIQ
jgi:hypothetical protein